MPLFFRRTAAALIATALLPACAPLQSAPERISGYRLVEPAAVVSDACLLRQEGDTRVLLRDASSAAGQALAAHAAAQLQAHGFSIGTVRTPLACALPPDRLRGVQLLSGKDGEPLKNGVQDLVIDANVRSNYELAAAYRHLLQGIRADSAALVHWGGEVSARVDEKEARALERDLGARYVWVVTGGGIGTGAKEGRFDKLLDSMIQGANTSEPYRPNTLNNLAALVDLQARKLRWRNVESDAAGDPADLGHYQADWSGRMLAEALPYGGKAPAAEALATAPQAPAAMAPSRPGPYVAVQVSLLGRPQANSPVTAVLPAGTPVDILRQLHNATGEWLYVSTGAGAGWLPVNVIAVR